MSQYIPLLVPASGGSYQDKSNVIDPEVIEYEFAQVAAAHNSHATQDFAAVCVSTAQLQKAYSRIIIPFGLTGTWTYASPVTLSDNLCGLLVPYTFAINGGYIQAEKITAAVGDGATIPVNLYRNASKIWTNPIQVNNSHTLDQPSILYSLTDPSNSPAVGDYLYIRMAATTLTVKNLVFYLDCTVLHST